MENYHKELTQIKTILKNNPKGMTVTDISRKIHINRNSVAKYLDILLISGHAEMVTFGPAKVFFPSSRIPLSALLTFTHDYIIVLDKDLKFLQASDNFLRFCETTRSEIIGHSLETFSHAHLPIPELAQNAQRALQGKELTIEKKYLFPHQTYHLRIRHIPTTFDDGEPGVTLLIEDITERKQTEEKMKQALVEWEVTFNAISDMVFIQNNDHSILKLNRAFAEFLHKKPEEFIGKKCYDLLHGMHHTHPACPCTIAQHTKKPATADFYEPFLEKHLGITATPLLNEEGAISGYLTIIRDNTGQRKQQHNNS